MLASTWTRWRGRFRFPISRSVASTFVSGAMPMRVLVPVCFVVAEVVESPDHLVELLSVLDVDDHLLVRLHASPASLRARIIAREPEGWFGLEFLLVEMERLHATMPLMEGVHLVLDTEHRSVREITESIRAARPEVLNANQVTLIAPDPTPAPPRVPQPRSA